MKGKRGGTEPVSVIGAGNVGTALAVALAKRRHTILSVVSRTGRDALALAARVGCKKASTQPSDVDPRSATILIAVTDSSLPEVARELARIPRFPFRGKTFLHTSGLHSAKVLEPLARKGAEVAAFHPVQSFPGTLAPARLAARLTGICFGTDGTEEGLRRADAIAAGLGSRTVRILPEARPLYHVACVFASGYLSVLLGAISRLASLSGVGEPWPSVFGPLMTGSMETALREPAARSLTGPVPRMDMDAAGRHIEALAGRAPALLPLYTVFAIDTARILRDAGRITDEQYSFVASAMRKAIGKIPAGRRAPRSPGRKLRK